MARPDPVAAAAQANHVTLTKNGGSGEMVRERPRGLYGDPRGISPRAPYAWGRISRICEGAQPSRNANAGSRYEDACKTAACPALAREYLEQWFFFMSRAKSPPLFGIDHNPYRHLSAADAWGKFYRRVEDICDRSTGKLGPWHSGLSETGAARNRG